MERKFYKIQFVDLSEDTQRHFAKVISEELALRRHGRFCSTTVQIKLYEQVKETLNRGYSVIAEVDLEEFAEQEGILSDD